MIASRHSVQRRLVAYVSLTMLFLVAFAVALTYHMSYQQVMVNAMTLERDLVRTVQAQAEVAVFAANSDSEHRRGTSKFGGFRWSQKIFFWLSGAA